MEESEGNSFGGIEIDTYELQSLGTDEDERPQFVIFTEGQDDTEVVDDFSRGESYIEKDTEVVTVETVITSSAIVDETPSITFINLEQCNVCGGFYEQIDKPVANSDLNHLIFSTILDVQPGRTAKENKLFYSKYIFVCKECISKARKYEKLWLEMKILKNEFLSTVVHSLENAIPVGQSPIYLIKDRILKRWASINKGNSKLNVTSTTSNSKPMKPPVVKRPSSSRNSKDLETGCATKLPSSDTKKEQSFGSVTYTIVDPVDSEAILITEDEGDKYQDNDFKNQDLHPLNWGGAEEIVISASDITSTRNNVAGLRYVINESESLDMQMNCDSGEILFNMKEHSNVFKKSTKSSTLNVNTEDHSSPNEVRKSKVTKIKKIKDQKSEMAKKAINTIAEKLPPFFCDGCGRVFGKKITLRVHTKICEKVEDGREKKCTLCSENLQFCSWQDLKDHLDDIHPSTQVERCTLCRFDFLPNTLRSHACSYKAVDYSNLKSDFKCEFCGKAYVTRSNLTDHIRRYHKDATKWTCKYCTQKFSTKELLDKHELNHKNPKSKFVCSVCKVCCTSSYGLKQHQRIHTGELPFSCSICDRRFRAKSVLNNHMVTHTQERKHECDVCGMKFALNGTLVRHWKRHQLPDTVYTKKCPLCIKRFKKVSTLKEHMLLEHPGTPELGNVLQKYNDIDDHQPSANKEKSAKLYSTKQNSKRKISPILNLKRVPDESKNEVSLQENQESPKLSANLEGGNNSDTETSTVPIIQKTHHHHELRTSKRKRRGSPVKK